MIVTHKLSVSIQLSFMLLMMGVYVCTIQIYCGLIMLLSSLLLIPFVFKGVKIVKIYGVRKNTAREKNVSGITEYLLGSQTLRSYGLVGEKNAQVTDAMREYSLLSYQYEKATLPPGLIFNYCSYIAMALMALIGTRSLLNGEISPSQFIMIMIIPTFVGVINMTNFINLVAMKNLSISKDKLQNILISQEEKISNESFSPNTFDISFHNVDFSYIENEPVLKNISFTISNGIFAAIVGDSGSGKSTILNLVTKYYNASNGDIQIGGKSIKNASAEQVLANIALVDQDVFLFNDTIRNNIRYARPLATDDEIENACKLAACHDFITKTENGYDTVVGENGNKLSGGEKQRISIARAILRDSSIILLDEATASLDIENELLVKQAISNLIKKNKTVIMIAHTLPIIQKADLILVIEDGTILEQGNHSELLGNNGKYSSMWEASKSLE